MENIGDFIKIIYKIEDPHLFNGVQPKAYLFQQHIWISLWSIYIFFLKTEQKKRIDVNRPTDMFTENREFKSFKVSFQIAFLMTWKNIASSRSQIFFSTFIYTKTLK